MENGAHSQDTDCNANIIYTVTQVKWSEGTDADFDMPTEQSPTGFGSTGK